MDFCTARPLKSEDPVPAHKALSDSQKQDSLFIFRSVCGNNGVTYLDACMLKRTACLYPDMDLELSHNGWDDPNPHSY